MTRKTMFTQWGANYGIKNASTLIKGMIGATDGGGQKESCIFFYIHIFLKVLSLSCWRAWEAVWCYRDWQLSLKCQQITPLSSSMLKPEITREEDRVGIWNPPDGGLQSTIRLWGKVGAQLVNQVCLSQADTSLFCLSFNPSSPAVNYIGYLLYSTPPLI